MAGKLYFFCCFIITMLLCGCKKNLTKIFPDAEAEGLAIFSDKGNNILSCYVNDKPWKTIDRIAYSGFPNPPSTHYELYIDKLTGIEKDTLIFTWEGHFTDDTFSHYLSLSLFVKPNFARTDISSLSGQRITIDSLTTGFYSADINNSNSALKGNGSIYFNQSSFDSTGRVVGLLEANINGLKISKGRFDEDITSHNIFF